MEVEAGIAVDAFVKHVGQAAIGAADRAYAGSPLDSRRSVTIPALLAMAQALLLAFQAM